MRKLTTVVLALFLMVSMTLVACGNQTAAKPAKEVLQEAFNKSTEVKTAKFDGTMKLNLEMPDSALEDPAAAMVLNMLNSAELQIRGTSQIDPMMSEMFVTVRVTGDTEMAINLSFLMTEEKMWVKIPNTPFLPLPEELINKYLEIDFQELSELSGEEIDFSNQSQYQELAIELMEIFFGAFEEDDYFSTVSKEDAGLPDNVDAAQIVKFELTNDNLRPFIESFMEVLPEMMEKLAEIDSAGISQADIDNIKADIEEGKAEIEENWDKLQEKVSINKAEILTGINKDGYITYNAIDVSVQVTDEGETGTIGFTFEINQTEINKDPEFEISVPGEEESVPFMDFMNQMMLSGM